MTFEKIELARDNFEAKWNKFFDDIRKTETERLLFVRTFPMEKIINMEIDDYVIGKSNKNSFCYWIENRLKKLGDMHGSTSFKFGVYFGRTKSEPEEKYRFTQKFGDNYIEAFENVKEQLFYLLRAGKCEEYSAIRTNKLSPMFKGKILSTYYPEKYLNVFADEHLTYYLNELHLIYPADADELEKRLVLVRFKNNNRVMAGWSVVEYATFLWDSIGAPKDI